MRLRRFRLLIVCIVLVLTGTIASCDLVAGDSLVVNAASSDPGANYNSLAADSTVDGVVLRGVSGIAPCDYCNLMSGDYGKWQPKRVSLSFSGNNVTNCMKNAQGQKLVGAQLIAK